MKQLTRGLKRDFRVWIRLGFFELTPAVNRNQMDDTLTQIDCVETGRVYVVSETMKFNSPKAHSLLVL